MIEIIPAVLTDDIRDLERKIRQVRGLAGWVHIDIADGKFVNNTSVSIKELSTVRLLRDFFVEAHLMVQNPGDYFSACQELGVARVVFHAEAVDDIQVTIKKARQCHFALGMALNPNTPVATVSPYVTQVNGVLVMSVVPGFQGQEFIPDVLLKVKTLREGSKKNLLIGLDGGINLSNIKKAAESGADYLVVGSGVFNSENIKERLEELQHALPQ